MLGWGWLCLDGSGSSLIDMVMLEWGWLCLDGSGSS